MVGWLGTGGVGEEQQEGNKKKEGDSQRGLDNKERWQKRADMREVRLAGKTGVALM